MEAKEIVLPRPLAHQAEVLDDPSRFKVIAAGRRWGKTVLGLIATIDGHGGELNIHGERPLRGARSRADVWWVAPTYGIASDIWRALKNALRGAWTDKHEMERRIELIGGGSITVKSADNPDTLRGSGLDGLVIDECAMVKEDAWGAALRPALADKQGWCIFISSPKGENWFHTLWKNAHHLDGWRPWQQPSNVNVIIPPEELEGARMEMTHNMYLQEFGAQFVSSVGGMFRREWFKIIEREAVPADRKRVRFWDLAATEKQQDGDDPDYTVGALVSLSADGGWYIEDITRLRGTPRTVESAIRNTAELDGKGVPIYIEQEPGASGVALIDYYIRTMTKFAVRGYRPSGPKEVRANPFSAQAEHGNVSIVRAPWNGDFVDECATFPGGSHDDQVDATSGAFAVLGEHRWDPVVAPFGMSRVSPWKI